MNLSLDGGRFEKFVVHGRYTGKRHIEAKVPDTAHGGTSGTLHQLR